jgi:hypothetical protein
MIRSFSTAQIRRALVLSVLAGLAACQGQPSKPTATSSGGAGGSCAAERADFAAATDRATLPADQPGGTDAFYASLRRNGPTPVLQAQGLATEAARTADEVDHVTSSFATLKACRLDRAEEIRTGVAGGSLPADRIGPLMAGERDGFQGEIETARAAVQQLDGHVTMLRLVADRLAATAPGVDLKVARAAAAPPAPAQYFVATAAAPIYAKPTASAAHIANLRRLQRVQGPGGDTTAGWVQLTLNDGSAGYVESSVLRPAQPNASAIKAAARAEAAREAEGDPVASAVLIARVGLPDREQALSSLIETSAEGLAVAFTTALPAPDEPDTDSAAAPPS